MVTKTILILFAVLLIGVIFVVAIRFLVSKAQPPRPLGVVKEDSVETLKPCKNNRNCYDSYQDGAVVITQKKDIITTKQSILNAMFSLPRVLLVSDENNYIHFIQRSSFFGFIDDIEFFIPKDGSPVQYRSASRVGTGDLGVNRARIEEIAAKINS